MDGDQSEAEGEQKATEATEEAGEELFEHHQLVADPGQVPLRVDKFILNLVSNMSFIYAKGAISICPDDNIPVNER